MKKIVIIGGGAAGPKAAAKAKRMNSENIVELYTDEKLISYSACGLPYFIEGTVKSINQKCTSADLAQMYRSGRYYIFSARSAVK